MIYDWLIWNPGCTYIILVLPSAPTPDNTQKDQKVICPHNDSTEQKFVQTMYFFSVSNTNQPISYISLHLLEVILLVLVQCSVLTAKPLC